MTKVRQEDDTKLMTEKDYTEQQNTDHTLRFEPGPQQKQIHEL